MKTHTFPIVARCLLGASLTFALTGCPSGSEESASPPAEAPAVAPPAEKPAPAAPAAVAPPDVTELFVDVEAEPDEGAPPLAVQFTATVEDNTGAVECEWEMGDGSPNKTGLSPMHVFSEVEDYEVLVRCTDAAGIEGEGEVDVFVEDD